MMVDLYEHEGEMITEKDINDALREVGCRRGDVVFVHSDVGVFGKLLCLDRNLFLGSICNAIRESVGSTGTVIMPTFTYSFCKDEPFDITNSISTVGVLTEYFRSLPGVSRSVHPIFSVAIRGRQREFFSVISKDSFDRASVFGKLHEIGGKILFLGAPFQSCTFIHHVEQMHGIPYRYMKTFDGRIINGKEEYEDKYAYFVRDLEQNVVPDFSRFEKYLTENGFMKVCRLGSGTIMLIEAEVFFDECRRLLDEDIYFLLREKPDEVGG